MTLRDYFFDAQGTPPDRIYTSDSMAVVLARIVGDGYIPGLGSELAVVPSTPAAMTVTIGLGTILVQGHLLDVYNTTETRTVDAADPVNPRIDRVMVRLNLDPAVRAMTIVVKPGTPAVSPVPPTTQRDATIWELSLAQVRVNAGAVSITAPNITDERNDPAVCGRARNKVFVPGSAAVPSIAFATDENTGLYRTSEDVIGFVAGGIERVRVSAAGILVGTDGAVGAPALAFTADTNTGIYRPATAEVAIATAGVQRVRVTAAGMTVAGTLSGADGAVAAPGLGFTADPDTGIWRPAANTLALSTAGIERLRVLADGTVALGTATVTAGYTLEVNGAIHTNGTIESVGGIFRAWNAGSTAAIRMWSSTAGPTIETNSGALQLNYSFGGSGVNVFNGAAGWGPIAASAFNVGSSREFKSSIADSAIGLATLLTLKPKSFLFQGETTQRLGFIAEEVKPLVGEACVTQDMPQVDAQGKPLPPKTTLALDVMGLLAIAVRAIQEQQAQLVALTTRVNALAARVP